MVGLAAWRSLPAVIEARSASLIPQSSFDEARPSERMFSPALKSLPATEADVEAYLVRQLRFDPDLWIVEIEDRAGQHFLDHIVR